MTTLGRYQILKHLATGGMAEVLLARAQGPFGSDHVVIKRVRRDQAGDPQFVKMFMDEATLAASLNHPNIVRVHEIGADQGEYFFAMEYVHGEDLRRVLMEVNRRRDKLPIALVTGIVAAAAAGLDHAHNQRGPNGEALGIVHRDVSPANILVGYDGAVKVADFGIAKAALRSVETQTGTLKGKVSYMSPEQVTGRPVDRRSDVYALGIVLYEVVTARRLFKGENDFLTMSSIVQGDIPLPSVYRPDLPRILEDIVMKALSPSAKDRFQSAEELRTELEKFTHAIGMRMSNESIADYMRKLFGERAQPWLTDSEPTHTTTIDFDGSASGLVQHGVGAAHRKAFEAAGANSPIAMSHRASTPQPAGQTATDSTTYPVADSSWVAKPPTGTGSGQPLAWSQQQPPPARRRFGIVLGMAGVAAIAGVIILVSSMKGGSAESKDVAAPTAEPTVTAAADETKVEPAPTPPDPVVAVAAAPTKAEAAAAAKAQADAKAAAAVQAAADAKAAKVEAARIAKEEAAEKVETAAKAAATAKAEKAEAARIAKEEAAAKAETAAKAAATAKAEKAEAARIARDEAAAKAEVAAKAAAASKAEKAEAARIAKAEAAAKAAERAEAAKVARAEKAKADGDKAKADAEKAEAARIAKAEKAAKAETTTAAKTSKPATSKPRPKPGKTEPKWNPNELFPE